MTFAEFQQALRDGSVAPVFVFHGDEPFLARLGVDLLKKHVLAPGSEAFDFVSLAGREASAETIVAQATTAPMLSDRRLTVVYDFERLNPSQRTKLLGYVRNPNQHSCVALVSFERLSGKNKFERDVLRAAAVVDCGRPSGEVLISLVRKMVKQRGAAIEDDALSALIDWTDGKLSRIANELDKLACFVREGDSFGLADVERVVGARAGGLKDLALAIAERKTGEALALLDELVQGGVDEAQLVSQLFGFWIALWGARTGARPGGFGPGARGHLLSALEDVKSLAGARTSREYARGVERFYRADTDIRRGVPPRPTVGLLVYELTEGRASAGSQ